MTEANIRRPLYGAAARQVRDQLHEPTDLDTAVSVAQRVLSAYSGVGVGDIDGMNRANGALTEALRLVLRALGAEPTGLLEKTSGERLSSQEDKRCPAAHPEDPTPCVGPVAVTVLDAENAGANGCEHHGARLLASLEGGRVYALPDAPGGAAIRVFKAADGIRPFCWYEDAPRTEPSQLSNEENRAGGDVR